MFILLGLSACVRPRHLTQNPANRAAPDIGKSFAVAPATAPVALHADQARVSITKGALEKEFLLHTSLVMQQTAPNFHAMKSRVVFFRRAGDKVVMIEASRGLLLTTDYPQTLPLAEFAITNETDDLITIDFNVGMNRLLLGSDFQTHEDNDGAGQYVSVKSSFSYLSRAAVVGDQLLEVHQTSLIELPVRAVMVHLPIEAIYYLTPYRTNPDFKPTVAPANMDHFGFVEAASQYNGESGQITFAAKRDISKPIVYTISSNTPARYRAAIRDGALYWNKAFGRAVIEVVEATEPGRVPDPLANVIRWVDYESAGFAYADLQSDPRTGEILHQQIYLTSAWARVARADLRTHQSKPGERALLRRLGLTERCTLEINADVARDLDQVTAALTDQTRVDKAVNDTLRAVVAHEVGHTLGLLHNFAGTLAANYELDAREDILQTYLSTGAAAPDLVVSSSVMDYMRPVETFLFGDQILRAKRAAAHDEKAIQTLYLDQKFKPTELPLYCGDHQVGRYADCARFTAGRSLLAWFKYDGRRWIETLPRRMLDGFIDAKVPPFGEVSAGVASYQPNLKRLAARMFQSHANLVKLLRGERRLLSVERQFANHGPAFKREIDQRTTEAMVADLTRNEGLEKILLKANPKVTSLMAREFERLLSDPAHVRGRTLEDKPYEFTIEDLAQMRENAKHIFTEMTLEMARAEINALGGKSMKFEEDESPEEQILALLKGPPQRFEFNPVTRDFATYLARRAAFFLFATHGEALEFKRQMAWSSVNASVEGAVGDETTMKLPRFAYPFDLRLKTAELLRPDRGQSPAWGHNERRVVGALYAKMFGEAAPGIEVNAPDSLDGWPPEALKWMLEARELGALLELSSQRLPRAEVNKPSAGP